MIQVFSNLIKLFLVLRERGNWKLIRHSQKQLIEFYFLPDRIKSNVAYTCHFLLVLPFKRSRGFNLALRNVRIPFFSRGC